ncbi:MAG: tRNA (adenosine(37)-N6)-dimethylallyltransferase [Thermoleophilia bacterium]
MVHDADREARAGRSVGGPALVGAPQEEAYDRGLVIAIFGPTGVGKTEVASLVALELGVRVISCDSMQIYRDFPVLTNQPRQDTAAGEVVHELVGVADAGEEWSAARYGRRAQALIDADIGSSGWAVIAGGTGLYMRAALAPLAMSPAFDPERRATLELFAATEGPYRLHDRLAAADPETARKIHPHNVRRVVRALEIIESGGASALSERGDLWLPQYRHPTLLVVLTAERAELRVRIERRAKDMLAGGAVEEVRKHRALHPRPAPVPAAPPVAESGASGPQSGAPQAPEIPPATPRGVECAIGYREVADYLDGRLSLDEAAAQVASATGRYARRQNTWLRKLEDAVMIDTSGREAGEISAQVLKTALAARRGVRGPGP